MSKKTHEKQLAAARAKRDQEHEVVRAQRNRWLGIIGVLVLAVVVVGVALATRDSGGEVAVGDADAVSQFGTDGDVPTDDASLIPSDAPLTDETVPATPDPVTTGTAVEPCENPGEGAPEPDTSLQFDEAPPADYASGTVTATVVTTCGTFVMELDADGAPQTVSNFAFLADQGFYDGVPFHRVKDQFVIQGGDPTGTGSGGPGYDFADELALAEQLVAEEGTYTRGTVAMANAGPNTNGSQFFVVQPEGGFAFPPDYAVFGRVIDGMDVVDRIAQGPVGGPNQDLAVDPVRMITVTIE